MLHCVDSSGDQLHVFARVWPRRVYSVYRGVELFSGSIAVAAVALMRQEDARERAPAVLRFPQLYDLVGGKIVLDALLEALRFKLSV